MDEILNKVTVKGSGALTNTQEDSASQSSYWLRERTFTDTDLTDAAAVQAKATELLEEYKDPLEEIPIILPGVFVLELFDSLLVTCADVGLNGEAGVVKYIKYSYGSQGLRTVIKLKDRGFTMSDILSEHERKLMGEE